MEDHHQIPLDKYDSTISDSLSHLHNSLRNIQHLKYDASSLKASSLDKSQKKRNLFMLANTVVCVLATIIILQLDWNAKDGEMQFSRRSLAMKLVVTVLTAIQIGHIFEYYITTFKYLGSDPWKVYRTSQKRRMKYQRYERSTPRTDAISNRNLQRMLDSTIWIWMRATRMPLFFWLEVLVTMPVPFLLFHVASERFSSLIYLRLYIVFRVLRDFSPEFKSRRSIKKSPELKQKSPLVNSFFMLNKFFTDIPKEFLSFFIAAIILIGAHAMYLVERERQPEDWTFFASFFVSVNCVLAGWAGDTFYEFEPDLWLIKVFTVFHASVGLALTTILFEYIYIWIRPDNTMRVISYLWAKIELNEREVKDAALLIQRTWRYNRKRRELSAHGGRHLDRKLIKLKKNFRVDEIEALAYIKRTRKDAKKLEMQYKTDMPWERKLKKLSLERRKALVDQAIQIGKQEIMANISGILRGVKKDYEE